MGAQEIQLRHLLDNRSEAAALGARGQMAVRRDFTAAEMAEKTRDLYRRVTA